METLRKLVTILLLEMTALCILATYRWVDPQSTAVLAIFNVLFISIFFKLNGSLPAKLGLLAAGNMMGMLWNYCFHMLMYNAVESRIVANISLNTFYTVAYPFLNSFWVIAFWAVSLTALHPHKLGRKHL